MRIISTLVVTALAIGAAPLAAQDLPRFCFDRPGLGSSTCSTAPGHVAAEIAAVDWISDTSGSERSDRVLVAGTSLRLGISDTTEIQLGFTPFVNDRERSGATVAATSGVGDVRLGVRRNLVGNDEGRFAAAIEGFVTLPVARSAIGAGDWSAGALLPISYALTERLSLAATTIMQAAVDGDGDGRHLSATQIVGLSHPITSSVAGTVEIAVTQDDDPADATTQTVFSTAVAWSPQPLLQFDAGLVTGLSRNTSDLELYLGVSHLF